MQATLNLRPLAAASLCASSEERRFYLCGVLVEIEPRAVTYVATDGHRLFAHREELAACELPNTLLGRFIIPTKSCRAIKLGKKAFTDQATLTRGDDGGLLLAYFDERHYFKPVDGEFPNWRAVMPKKGGEAYAHFDGRLVATFSAIAAALGDDNGVPRICPMDANSPALVVFHGREATTFGVIMPMRGEKVSRIVPAWALPEAEASVEAAAA
jgi:DNA polymerase-3 subunit beta